MRNIYTLSVCSAALVGTEAGTECGLQVLAQLTETRRPDQPSAIMQHQVMQTGGKLQ